MTDYLQTTAGYTSTSTPPAAAVEAIIEGVEDDIDDEMGHSWRVRRTAGREWHDIQLDYQWRIGWPVPYVQLDHWQLITPLLRTEFDVLEVMEGTGYVDWLDPAQSKVEGRALDYFIEERQGRIYFPRSFPIFRSYSKAVRVTYRYGEAEVTGTIHRLAVWMSAIEMLRTDHQRVVAGGGLNPVEGQSVSETIAQIQVQVDKKFNDKRWLRSPRPNFRISGGTRKGWW